MLEKEFKYYLANQDELVKKYNHKFLVIKNETVVKAYDTVHEAIYESDKTLGAGTFLVQYCEAGNTSTTQHFHSRVTFA